MEEQNMEIINLTEFDEKMPNFYWKLGENVYLSKNNFRVARTISGTAIKGEDSYLLEARHAPEENLLKFTLYYLNFLNKKEDSQLNWINKNWKRVEPNSDNTIPPYGMSHYLHNIEPKEVDAKVKEYFEEFKNHVEEGKNSSIN